jgi:(S)-2-hydroxyglutarate dehydrogenase
MMTPPFIISAKPRFTSGEPVARATGAAADGFVAGFVAGFLEEVVERLVCFEAAMKQVYAGGDKIEKAIRGRTCRNIDNAMETGAERVDLVVVGAGIVGLATARAALLSRPGMSVVVVDKEASLAEHQSGRNSNVIHAGVYYRPGSEKARLCSAGRTSMVAYCAERAIAHEVCGKVVVATSAGERSRLDDLQARCDANGVNVRRIGMSELREIEPHARGVDALHVRDTGIADYPAVCRSFAADITAMGGSVRLGVSVVGGREMSGGHIVSTTTGDLSADHVVTCAGLHADRVAELISGPGAADGIQIIPFRGEYFELAPAKSHLVTALIYPVPDPQFPFLGVHLTRGINGRIHAGPNAVLALAREGYSWRHIDRHDLAQTLRFSGFRHVAKRHWRYGLSEMVRSVSTHRFAAALQQLVPAVEASDLEPAPAGVRAQAVASDGTLLDDFVFRRLGRALHVLNAPSPAATASLEIGAAIVRQLLTT